MEVKEDKKGEKEMRVRMLIVGRVQGVGFRYWVRRQAERLGLSGWVRNLDDEKVEAELAGEGGKIEKMVELCKQGPPLSRVDEVKTEKIEGKWQRSGEFVILK